jgi:hypothetical protein
MPCAPLGPRRRPRFLSLLYRTLLAVLGLAFALAVLPSLARAAPAAHWALPRLRVRFQAAESPVPRGPPAVALAVECLFTLGDRPRPPGRRSQSTQRDPDEITWLDDPFGELTPGNAVLLPAGRRSSPWPEDLPPSEAP